MLKIQQRHIMKQQTLANTSKPSAPPPPLVSSTGTPTKQESSAVNGEFLDKSQIPALNYDLLKAMQALLLVRMGSLPCVMHCMCLTKAIQYDCGFFASLSSFPCINPHSRKVCVQMFCRGLQTQTLFLKIVQFATLLDIRNLTLDYFRSKCWQVLT